MRNIIITGASRGIGRATALQLAQEEKVRIGIIARSRTALKGLCEEIRNTGSECEWMAVDLGAEDAFERLSVWVEEMFGSIDVLINNAGAIKVRPFHEMDVETFDHIYKVNVWGVSLMTQIALKGIADRDGDVPLHIVNVSSMGGVQGSAKFPGLSLYSSSKGAVNILTECVAEEYKEFNVRVNCLALGAVQTEMLSEAFPDFKADKSPEEMGAYISGFAMTGWRHFNGKTLQVATTTP